MSYNEFHEYNDVINNLLSSPRLKDFEEKFNLSKEDPIMYLAFSSLLGASSVKKAMREIKQKEIEISKENATKSPQEKKSRIQAGTYCGKIYYSLTSNILNQVNFFENAVDQYNMQFSGFNRYSKYEENPYLITKRQLKEYLENSSPNEQQLNIEHYLKNMTLANKASKILGIFKDYSTKQLIDTVREINKEKRKKDREAIGYSTYKKDYNELFKKIYTLSNEALDNGKPLKVDFLNTYSKYIQKNITEDELKNSPAYIEMNNLIQSENNSNCYLTPEAVYNNLAFEHAISSAYLCKSYLFKKAFREYVRLSKGKDSDKYKVVKSTDSSINHNSFSGKCFNIRLKLYNKRI